MEVKYGREGLGANAPPLLVKGAEAPLLEMQKGAHSARTVNACYGYNAIARIRFTQTAATGFGEAAAEYRAAPADAGANRTPPLCARAEAAAAPVGDPGLRSALEALGARILSDGKQQKRPDR